MCTEAQFWLLWLLSLVIFLSPLPQKQWQGMLSGNPPGEAGLQGTFGCWFCVSLLWLGQRQDAIKQSGSISIHILNISLNAPPLVPVMFQQLHWVTLVTAHDAILNPMAFCIVNKSSKALSPAGTDWSTCPGYQFLLPSHLCVRLPAVSLPLLHLRLS